MFSVTSRLLLALGVVALGCDRSQDGPPLLDVKVLTTDPHVGTIARLDLEIRRNSVSVRDQLVPGTDEVIRLPAQKLIALPIAAGAIAVEAVARDREQRILGAGEATASARAGVVTAVSVEIFSVRSQNYPSRRRGVSAEPELLDAGGLVATPDAGLDAAPVVDGPGREMQGQDASGCVEKKHQIPADAVASLDYGPGTPDPKQPFIVVASGRDHGHVHDYAGWVRFRLTGVSPRARLLSAALSVRLELMGAAPPLAILHTQSDRWTYAALRVEMPNEVVRGPDVSGPLGMPRPGRASYPLDLSRYARLWTDDLADGVLTLGMISTTAPDAQETYAYFYGLTPASSAPYLELVTCE